jgi:formylglycine-generating enzyme required for sulfatase activity
MLNISHPRELAEGRFWQTERHRPQDSGWGRGRRPAIYVSYDDAKAYIDWLRQKSGKAYRLPSEAEWEFAARGGTSTPFAGGETLAPTQANFDASNLPGSRKQGTYQGTTVEVGTFPANPYGQHDMEGNVFEWVEERRGGKETPRCRLHEGTIDSAWFLAAGGGEPHTRHPSFPRRRA